MISEEPKDTVETAALDLMVSRVVPVDRLGYRELLRVGAGLARVLGGAYGRALADATQEEGVDPVPIDLVLMCRNGRGVLASSERRLLALGTQSFLLGLGIAPPRVDLQAVASVEAVGGEVMYVVVVDRRRCLGLFGFEPRRC